MLVLSRRIGERIHVGNDVEIVVLRSRGGVVRLGIVAPPEVPVHREEVRQRIQIQDAHRSARRSAASV